MKKILLIMIFASLSISACGGRTPALKVSDPQFPIEVGVGKDFNIVLEANPTTGYHWAIVSELDQNMVQFVKTEYTSTSDPNLVGGGGLDVWVFKSVKTGETQITLGYYPPSNDPVDPQQTTTFTVVIK
jgi:inhibitor of cysteine peptidase